MEKLYYYVIGHEVPLNNGLTINGTVRKLYLAEAHSVKELKENCLKVSDDCQRFSNKKDSLQYLQQYGDDEVSFYHFSEFGEMIEDKINLRELLWKKV